MRVRPLNKEKYKISKHRFAEIYHFCMQYNEWRDELKFKNDNIASPIISDIPSNNSGTKSNVENLALRRTSLENKCKLIEQTAIEADPGIYQYILKAVTNEHISYNYLKMIMNIPCGKNYYYEKRKKFYYLLAQKI